ncbi:MAG TPA: hotdog domain-containing protein [Anaerolineaceae bacterium]|nr:hotdog domain-containing protein [Anaerolineaceae bacterium]
MDVINYSTYHLVKSEDLNHHGTLYAGRSAEWFVESGFIAASSLTKPENIVCLKIHGMTFNRPVKRGEVVQYESKIILSGRTRLVAVIQMKSKGDIIVKGFITFIHVDMEGKPLPHGIEVIPTSEEDKALLEEARLLS